MPLYRAPLIRSVLDVVHQMDESREILADISPEELERIETAGPASWLPFSMQMRLLEPVYRHRGVSAVVALTRMTVRQAISHRLFSTLRAALIQPFRPDPRLLLGFVPKGMNLASRNMGRLIIEPGDTYNSARVTWCEMPVIARVDFVALGHQGAYTSLLQWGGVPGGAVDVDLSRLEVGEARYDVSWGDYPS
jgi:hypothetical protein